MQDIEPETAPAIIGESQGVTLGGGIGPTWPAILAALFFPVAALLAWSNTFSSPFMLDDGWNLLKNPGMERLWPPWWPGVGSAGTGLAGRPVTAFTFALNHAFSGATVRGYHVGNLFIHVLAALVLFGLLRRAFAAIGRFSAEKTVFSASEAGWLAFFCSLAWMLHPLTIQAVTYITQRLESLAALFYLLTLYGAARSLEPGIGRTWRAFWSLVSVFAFFLGVGSKEILVTAPFAVFMYEWIFSGQEAPDILRRGKWRYIGYGVGLLALFALVVSGQTIGHAYAGNESNSWLDYALFQPRVIWRYIRLAFWPFGLSFDYGQHRIPGGNIFDSTIAVKLAWAAALGFPLGLAALLFLKRRAAGLALVLFFLVLAPTSSIMPLFIVAEEQRAYLPLAALLAAVLAGSYRLLRRTGISGRALACLGLILAATLGYLTHARNMDYASEESIWKATLKTIPNNPRAYASLGKLADANGRLDLAVSLYKKAIELYPDYAIARINMGAILEKQGRRQEAADQYVAVLTRPSAFTKNSDRAFALSNLGNIFLDTGHPEKALGFYYQALALEPDFAAANSNLGAALAASGKPAEAIAPLMRAIELDPGIIEARLNLAMALKKLGRMNEAKKYIEEARSIAPGSKTVKSAVADFFGGK